MKKFLALTAFAVIGLTGCPSPSDNLCIEFYTCAEKDDPAAECQSDKDDLSDDDKACADACKAENDAFAQCFLDNGECKDKLYQDEKLADDCKDQIKAQSTCVKDNC